MQEACIVIPCYNEEHRLPKEEFLNFFNSSQNISFCFVNDGSNDQTISLLKSIQQGREGRIHIVDLTINVGKAEAVRQGIIDSMKWKEFALIGYLDADFATPLDEMHFLLEIMKKRPDCDIAFGSRVRLLGRTIDRKPTRHYMGRVFSTFASFILKLPVYDTQCGAKVIRRQLAEQIFSEKFISSWLFDVEIFARIRNKYGIEKSKNAMVEFPLTQWIEKGDSKLKMKHLFKVPLELIRINNKYKK